LNTLLDNPVGMNKMKRRAYEFGKSMVWPVVAEKYVHEFVNMLKMRRHVAITSVWNQEVIQEATLPEVCLEHLKTLSDNTGLFQHASHGVPSRQYGYSADDIGRGLAAMVYLYHLQKENDAIPLIRTYLSFLQHAQTSRGNFHNVMSFDNNFLDEEGSEDTLGRVIWGLGLTMRWGPNDEIRALCQKMMEKTLPRIFEVQAIRSKAYIICGLYHILKKYSGAAQYRSILENLARSLVETYSQTQDDDWHWFEDTVTYANAKISQALLLAYECCGNHDFCKIGLESLEFLTREQWNGVYFELIGNEGWFSRGGVKALFGQQPIEAGYLVEAYVAAYNVTKKERFLTLAEQAFEWFMGRNRLSACLYNFSTGSVFDGLDSHGVSLNQGAEPTVCYLLAMLSLLEVRSKARRKDEIMMSENAVQLNSQQSVFINAT
jgi:hypothetical protein